MSHPDPHGDNFNWVGDWKQWSNSADSVTQATLPGTRVSAAAPVPGALSATEAYSGLVPNAALFTSREEVLTDGLEDVPPPDAIALDLATSGASGQSGTSVRGGRSVTLPSRKRKQAAGTGLPGMITFRIDASGASRSIAASSQPKTSLPTQLAGNGGDEGVEMASPSELGSADDAGPPVGTVSVPRGQQNIIILPTSTAQKRGYFAPKVWDAHRDVIKRLYLDEGRSLKEVAEYMEQNHGFKATPKMYKTKFKVWGFGKNNTEREAKQILFVKLERDAQGKPSAFSRNGKQIDVLKYLKRKGMKADYLLGPDAAGQLPPHVRCWTPPPSSPRSLSPPASFENKEKFLTLIKSAMNIWAPFQNSGDFGLEWQAYSSQRSVTLVRSLVQASVLFQSDEKQQHLLAMEQVRLNLYKYAEDFNPSTTMSLFSSSAAWQNHRLTQSVWNLLTERVAQQSTPLRPLFALVHQVVTPPGGLQNLHELMAACFEGMGAEMEARWGDHHPGVLTFWLGTGHDLGYSNQALFEKVVARIPALQVEVAAALGPDSLEAWESKVYGFTALALLGMARVEASLSQIERTCAAMQATGNPRMIPLQLTCLHMLYAFHRSRSSGEANDHDIRRSIASHYLERYVELKMAHLLRGNQDLLQTLNSARRWCDAVGDTALAAKIDGWRLQCEAMLESEQKRKKRQKAGGTYPPSQEGQQDRNFDGQAAIPEGVNVSELGTFTLQRIIRTML